MAKPKSDTINSSFNNQRWLAPSKKDEVWLHKTPYRHTQFLLLPAITTLEIQRKMVSHICSKLPGIVVSFRCAARGVLHPWIVGQWRLSQPEQMDNHLPSIIGLNIPDHIAICFHALQHDYRDWVDDVIGTGTNAAWKQYSVTIELLPWQKQLEQNVQPHMV
jgi:hypothetical protein